MYLNVMLTRTIRCGLGAEGSYSTPTNEEGTVREVPGEKMDETDSSLSAENCMTWLQSVEWVLTQLHRCLRRRCISFKNSIIYLSRVSTVLYSALPLEKAHSSILKLLLLLFQPRHLLRYLVSIHDKM